MQIGPTTWRYITQRAVIAVLSILPIPVLAPNDLVQSDILELEIHFKVLRPKESTTKIAISEAQANHVAIFLNEKLEARGLRFSPIYSVIEDEKVRDLSSIISKTDALKLAERHSTKGKITVLVPEKVDFTAAYLGQPLKSGPIAIYGGKGGLTAMAQAIGQIFGFSHICGDARNIMYRPCANYSKKTLETLEWSYFTKDPEAQSFTQVLDLWKWEASGFLRSEAQKGRSIANVNKDLMIPTTP
jgi:hypothetical protein